LHVVQESNEMRNMRGMNGILWIKFDGEMLCIQFPTPFLL